MGKILGQAEDDTRRVIGGVRRLGAKWPSWNGQRLAWSLFTAFANEALGANRLPHYVRNDRGGEFVDGVRG